MIKLACATVLAALSMSGCAAPTGLGPPTSSDPGWITNRELEPANSLPRGSATSNPIAPATGIIGITRVQ